VGVFFFFGERIEEGGGLERQREGGLELKGGRERWERGKPLSHLPLPPRPRPPSPCGPSIPSNSLSPFLFPPLPPRILFFFLAVLWHILCVSLPPSGKSLSATRSNPQDPLSGLRGTQGLPSPPLPPLRGREGRRGPSGPPQPLGPPGLGRKRGERGKNPLSSLLFP
jgi:hypothetical protein